MYTVQGNETSILVDKLRQGLREHYDLALLCVNWGKICLCAIFLFAAFKELGMIHYFRTMESNLHIIAVFASSLMQQQFYEVLIFDE